MRVHHFTKLGLAVFLVSGCGASTAETSAETSPAPATSVGDESPAATEEPEAAVAEEPAPEPASGPASLTARVTVGGKPAPAHVRIINSARELVVEGDAGAALALPSGSYRIEVKIDDAKVLLDQPSQTQELEVHPGNNPPVTIDFAWAKVQLNVLVNGKSEAGATVELSRGGNVLGSLKSGGEFAPISPGRYDANVHVKGEVIKVEGLLFPEGATQTVPVAVQL